jgi:hypothetical protein
MDFNNQQDKYANIPECTLILIKNSNAALGTQISKFQV